MIITLTVNPSLDRTVELAAELARGGVQRATAAHQESGGKGVNVCRALTVSGVASMAVLPGDPDDPVVVGLRAAGVQFRSVPIGTQLRSNITLAEPDGTTTKINEPGPLLSANELHSLLELVVAQCEGASWLVLAGSLPPGVPTTFYATVIEAVRARYPGDAPLIAVDSSGAPLLDTLAAGVKPDLLKPNAEELSELSGLADGDALEADSGLAAGAAAALIGGGVGAVLATLGARGALLVTAAGAWEATHSPVAARSTVGAGDSALAGYLLAHTAGGAPEQCLRQAVAHGSAAASLPGSTVPALHQTTPEAVTVRRLTLPNTSTDAPLDAPLPKEEDQWHS
ncbi:1-phosphofructokinase family hexose kinase [Arthrobacter sp. H20]|uniref:1-phosphofructokinase family hexose kinase n=1 Tax=Arthrobacter sp. H20 TaxID=1267981 RepID=UPI00047C933B|nr:1-phosphofructokinase family hexose kinase [Arthrobacter sp. H20]